MLLQRKHARNLLMNRKKFAEAGMKRLSLFFALAILLAGCVGPQVGGPSYGQGYGGYQGYGGSNYPPPPQNPYATPWVGANTPWTYYQGDWFLNGVLYNFFGNQYGWAPYYSYPVTYVVRPTTWYAPSYQVWYQQHPQYVRTFEQKYPYYRGHRPGQHYDQRFYEAHHRGQGGGWQQGFHGVRPGATGPGSHPPGATGPAVRPQGATGPGGHTPGSAGPGGHTPGTTGPATVRGPGTTAPRTHTPGATSPAVRGPGSTAPGGYTRGTTGPGGPPPGTPGSAVRGPGTTTTKGPTPGAAGPAVKGPGTTAPRGQAPGTTGQAVRGPGATAPKTHTPGATAPAVRGPGAGGPGGQAPKATGQAPSKPAKSPPGEKKHPE
jgi:hypothetical protein